MTTPFPPLIAAAVVLSLATYLEATTSTGTGRGWVRPSPNSLPPLRNNVLIHQRRPLPHSTNVLNFSSLIQLRGGSLATNNEDDDNADNSEFDEDQMKLQRQQEEEEHQKLVKYRMEQQVLYQLRSTYLSELLAKRGVPLPTVVGVATPEGEKPPEKVDWDCAMCTVDDPKSCLYSFDAEPNTKVVAPIGTDQWISLTALNRLRRTDPTKVEPMWHSRYSILQSWFSDDSEFSLLQHVGFKGFLVSSVLLDGGKGMMLRSLLILSVLSCFILLMPLLEYIVGRLLVSAPFWAQWPTWGRVVRAGFPLKLLIGQLVWKGVASSFGKLESRVREYIVDLECEILEESVPLTVGPGSEGLEELEEEQMELELEDEEESIGFDESDDEDSKEDVYDEDEDEYDDEY